MNANKAYTDEYLQHVAALDGDAQGMKAARSHIEPVSYTHLDVYKRQGQERRILSPGMRE